MVSLPTAYWMGLNAAENARIDRQMWDLATRATRRRQVPVDDRAVLLAQVAQLQAQLQNALTEKDALWTQCNANYRAWVAESTAHKETQAELDHIMSTWSPF